MTLFGRKKRSFLEANSTEFLELFPADAILERVASGFQFTEGPIWIVEEKCLLFSDIPANRIWKWTPERIEIFREPSWNSNGLTRDRQTRLLACEHGTRRVSRTEKDGTIDILAERFEGKRLNSPNDIVVKSDDSVYFTDPPYGVAQSARELAFQGVYRIAPDGHTISLVADDFDRPNGLAFDRDERKLYINDSNRKHIRVFEIRSDGQLTNSLIFAEMTGKDPGVPDGMKIAESGIVFSTGPGGVWLFKETGDFLGRIRTPEIASNCAWGDDDLGSLYITAQTSVYKIRTNQRGLNLL